MPLKCGIFYNMGNSFKFFIIFRSGSFQGLQNSPDLSNVNGI